MSTQAFVVWDLLGMMESSHEILGAGCFEQAVTPLPSF